MPIEMTKGRDGTLTRVKADLIPCTGGPLKHMRLHRPYDRTIPLSDGKYVLVEQGGKAVYNYVPEGRRRERREQRPD